jgi:hypothetical protein
VLIGLYLTLRSPMGNAFHAGGLHWRAMEVGRKAMNGLMAR